MVFERITFKRQKANPRYAHEDLPLKGHSENHQPVAEHLLRRMKLGFHGVFWFGGQKKKNYDDMT